MRGDLTLRQRLAEGRPGLREAIAIVRQIAEALDAAHQADIIHRDIKPENVMIRRDGLVKVLDFGLARINELRSAEAAHNLPSLNPSSMTNPGAVMGTPRYMSPEQARGLKVDARTDLFSLGVVFYEMVTGEPAFAGASTAEVFAALLEKEPLPLRNFVPEMPDRLQEIISRMLVKERENRYETIRAFTDDLATLNLTADNSSADLRTQAVYALETNAQRRDTKEQKAQTTLPNQSGPVARLRFGWALAALALIVALGFGVWRWMVDAGHSSQLAVNAKFTPLIGERGAKDHPAFSPEETRIAFAWTGDKNVQIGPHDIYVKVIGTDGPPLRLTTAPEDDDSPVWTPDGRSVTFVRTTTNSKENSIK